MQGETARKRLRDRDSQSDSSDNSDSDSQASTSSSASAVRPSKSFHSTNSSAYTCSLPPTCHLTPTSFSTYDTLEAHWNTYHSHVCQAAKSISISTSASSPALTQGVQGEEGEKCGRIFPNKEYLELHRREFHDPILALKMERGERIYKCFLPFCAHLFRTPKSRRLHLIDKHDFPKEFMFNLIKYGIGDVMNKGGGLIRREWKERPSGEAEAVAEDGGGEEENKDKQEGNGGDGDVERLIVKLEGSSIGMVPRSVSRKKKEKEKGREMSIEPGGD